MLSSVASVFIYWNSCIVLCYIYSILLIIQYAADPDSELVKSQQPREMHLYIMYVKHIIMCVAQ